ncbi:MAG: molybdopterin-dependent oxidoreductase [Opitutus sp.]
MTASPDQFPDPAPRSTGNTAESLREKPWVSDPLSDEAAAAAMVGRTRRSFITAAAAALAASLGGAWLLSPGGRRVFAEVMRLNEGVGRQLYRANSRAPEFARDTARSPRVNGTEGLSDGFEPADWTLQVTGLAGGRDLPQFNPALAFDGADEPGSAPKFPAAPVAGLRLALADIQALPRVEMITELKCIEGWSTVVHWGGARVADFVAKYHLPAQNGIADGADGGFGLPPYVSLVTPDRGYYVGWDTASFLHPQTLLCYEMNGAPLSLAHGGPLRLVATSKYGIKQIKRIGRIAFAHQRPPDFWAEQGYDWFSGL